MERIYTFPPIPPDELELAHGTLVFVASRPAPDQPWAYELYEVFESDNPDNLADDPLPRVPSLAALKRATASDGEVRYFACDPELLDESPEALLPSGAYDYTIEDTGPLPFAEASGPADLPAQVLVLRPRSTTAAEGDHAVVPVYIQFVPKMRGTVRPDSPVATAYDPATQIVSGLTAGWTQTLPPPTPTEQSYSIHVVLASLLTFAGPKTGALPFRSAGPLQKLRAPWGERILYQNGWGTPPTAIFRSLSETMPPGWAAGNLGADGSADGRSTFHYLRQRVGRRWAANPQHPDDACWVEHWVQGLPRRPTSIFSWAVAEPEWSDDEAGLAIANGLPETPLDKVFGRIKPDRWADGVRLADCAPWLSVLPDDPLPPGSYLLAFDDLSPDSRRVYRTQPRKPDSMTAKVWSLYDRVYQFEQEGKHGSQTATLFISRRTRDGQRRPEDLIARTAKKRAWETWPRCVGLRWTAQINGRTRHRTVSYGLNDVRVDAVRDAWVVYLGTYDHLANGWTFPRALDDSIDILFSHRGIPTFRLGVPGDTVILHHASGWTSCRRMRDTRSWIPETSTLGTDLAARLYGGG